MLPLPELDVEQDEPSVNRFLCRLGGTAVRPCKEDIACDRGN